MNILHFNSNYLYSAFYKDMITELEKLNTSNITFSPIHGEIEFAVKPTDNVIYPILFKKNDRFFYFYKQRKIFKEAERIFNSKKFDVIHAHTLFTDGYSAYKLHIKYNTPYVVTVRNTDLNMFFKNRKHLRSLGVKILKNSKKIICVSPVYKEQLLKKYVKNNERLLIESKIEIIPNGINDFWHENINTNLRKVKKNTVDLLYVGAINKNKNITTVVKAIDLLKSHKINLKVVGKIYNKSVFKEISQHSSVQYYGSLNKQELIEIYRNSDIFVMPSKTETFGLVYLEAISQGLPVIYSKGQGFDEQFEEGEVGYSVVSDSPADISNKIELVIKNYDKITRDMTKKISHYKWCEVAKSLKNIYSE